MIVGLICLGKVILKMSLQLIETQLDGLRGFALFGIFLINIASFTIGGPPGFVESNHYVSNLVTATLLIFVESKFFTFFSFLKWYIITIGRNS